MNERMTYRAHARGLLILGLPLVGSHLAQLAIGFTDSLMLGRYAVEALAAVTLGFSVQFVLFIVGSGFAFAVLPMVASAAAENDEIAIRRVTRMGMWLSAIYGAVVMLPLIWAKPWLIALGQDPEVAALAAEYLRIFSFGMVPSLIVMVLKNYLAALERTQIVLWATVATAVANAIGNYALIFGNFGAPELGIKGAAITSVVMQLLSLVILVVYVNKTLPHHAMFQRFWRPDFDVLSRVMKLGWPIGLTNLAESALFSATAILMGWIGALPLAAHGVALQLASITFVVHLGLSQAATVRVGNALGRRDIQRLRDGALVAVVLSILFALVTVAIFLAIPEFLVGLYLDPTDPQRPEILRIGAALLMVAALFQLMDGAQVVALSLLRGLQDTKMPMVIAAISYWGVGIPMCYIFGFIFEWGGVGVWLGLVVGLSCASGFLMHRFWALKLPKLEIARS